MTHAFSFEFVKIQTLFHKTNTTEALYGLQSTKPENFKPKNIAMRRHKLRRSWSTPSHSYKSRLHFKKLALPVDPEGPNL